MITEQTEVDSVHRKMVKKLNLTKKGQKKKD